MRSFTRRASLSLALALLASMAATSASAQVCHRGTIAEGAIRWETTLPADASFVGPLPADLEIERIRGGALVAGPGGAVGVVRTPGHPGRILLVTRQAAGDALRPPLVRGPQRLAVSAADHGLLAFTPEAGSSLERYVGYQASPGIETSVRYALDEECGESLRALRIYVDAASFDDVRGRLASGAERGEVLLWVTAASLVLALVIGVLAYRRLSGRARAEYADAILDKRFKEIEARQGAE